MVRGQYSEYIIYRKSGIPGHLMVILDMLILLKEEIAQDDTHINKAYL